VGRSAHLISAMNFLNFLAVRRWCVKATMTIKKADVIERLQAFQHVGLLAIEPPGARVALYLVFRQFNRYLSFGIRSFSVAPVPRCTDQIVSHSVGNTIVYEWIRAGKSGH
jgi:hypothetical protein